MTLTEPQLFEHLGTNSINATEFLTCQAKPESLTRQPRSLLADNSKVSHDMLLHQAFTKNLPANLLDLLLLPVLFHCAALRSAAWVKVGNSQPVQLIQEALESKR
jgi:hypothetical protein